MTIAVASESQVLSQQTPSVPRKPASSVRAIWSDLFRKKKSLSLPKRHEKFSNHAHPIFHHEAGIDSIVITVVGYYGIRSVEWESQGPTDGGTQKCGRV